MSNTTVPGNGRGERGEAEAGRFTREGGRNRFTARTAAVVRVERVAPPIIRVTLSGPDFVDFTSAGPADHVRVYFPNPTTGELVAPTPVGPGEDGIVRPDREAISRDFTPLPRRADGSAGVDLDFFVHPDPGPASAWAESAQPGDRLVVLGPRGSRRAPQDIDGLILVCDETSLPSVSRWVRDVPPGTQVEVIAAVSGAGEWVAGYIGEVRGIDIRVHVVAADGASSAILDVLAGLAPIGDGFFVWAAGEASTLAPVRRHLRRTVGLSPRQAQFSGYWRRGVVAFDHHAPIDPFDPDQ